MFLVAFFKRYGKIIYEGLDRPKEQKVKAERRRKSIALGLSGINAAITTSIAVSQPKEEVVTP